MESGRLLHTSRQLRHERLRLCQHSGGLLNGCHRPPYVHALQPDPPQGLHCQRLAPATSKVPALSRSLLQSPPPLSPRPHRATSQAPATLRTQVTHVRGQAIISLPCRLSTSPTPPESVLHRRHPSPSTPTSTIHNRMTSSLRAGAAAVPLPGQGAPGRGRGRGRGPPPVQHCPTLRCLET